MNALLSDHPFVRKHQDKIHAVLSCFDRVIFRGYLPICHPGGVEGWLYHQRVQLKQFKEFAPRIAERLLQHAKDLAKARGRPYRYLPTRESKEELARQIAERDGVREGLVCVFSCLETCRTFRLEYSQRHGRLALRPDLRRCTVLYYFVMDKECGLIHIKLHTWLPLVCQVYINGHSWLQRQLDKQGIGYAMADNAFLRLSDPAQAQRIAERFCRQNWRRRLDAWARLVNPLLGDALKGQSYYWVVDQAEYSTDILFKDRPALASLYPALVEHASLRLGADDVLRFLGRKLTAAFAGEVQTERKNVPVDETGRVDGVRVKHCMKTNRLKMYDKQGLVLRVETVINNPREFRVRRWRRSKHGKRELAWLPLCKGVAWLWRYAQVSLSANQKYLEALAVVDDPGPARNILDRACTPARWGKRRRRALAPLTPHDQALFLAVLLGEHHLHGLRNRDVARHLFGEAPTDARERRRQSARVSRLLQLLRAHGLLAKIQRSRRYRVTRLGHQLMSAAVAVRYKYFPNELRQTA